jgi:hypothetical protein
MPDGKLVTEPTPLPDMLTVNLDGAVSVSVNGRADLGVSTQRGSLPTTTESQPPQLIRGWGVKPEAEGRRVTVAPSITVIAHENWPLRMTIEQVAPGLALMATPAVLVRVKGPSVSTVIVTGHPKAAVVARGTSVVTVQGDTAPVQAPVHETNVAAGACTPAVSVTAVPGA